MEDLVSVFDSLWLGLHSSFILVLRKLQLET